MPKMVKRLSSNTTLRTATPTSPELARNFMNFRFNHLKQRNTLPKRLGCAYEGFTTTNTSGRAETFGVGEAFGGGGMVYQDAGVTKVNED